MDLSWARHGITRIVAVYFLLMIMAVLAPEPNVTEAQLLCDGRVSGNYPDMLSCSKDARFKASECACFRPFSEWSRWYGLAVVPAIGGILGYLLLQGSLWSRLLWLNGIAAIVFVTDLVRLILDRGAVQLYALPSAPVSLLVFLLSISSVFALLVLMHRLLNLKPNVNA